MSSAMPAQTYVNLYGFFESARFFTTSISPAKVMIIAALPVRTAPPKCIIWCAAILANIFLRLWTWLRCEQRRERLTYICTMTTY
jgi:hypothetical protein